MTIDLFTDFSQLLPGLDYHLKRHAVLSSNVANAETPGYRPLDLTFDSYLSEAQSMRCTHEEHVTESGLGEFEIDVIDDTSVAAGNDGNTVSMEREMAKVVANSIRYRANVEILSRRMALLKYAVTDGQRR